MKIRSLINVGKIRKINADQRKLINLIDQRLEIAKLNNVSIDGKFIIAGLVDFIIMFRNNEIKLLELGAIDKLTQIPELNALLCNCKGK